MSGRGAALQQLLVNAEAWDVVWLLVRDLLARDQRVLLVIERDEEGVCPRLLQACQIRDARFTVVDLPESEFIGTVRLSEAAGIRYLIFLRPRGALRERVVAHRTLSLQLSRAGHRVEALSRTLLDILLLADAHGRDFLSVEFFPENGIRLEDRLPEPG